MTADPTRHWRFQCFLAFLIVCATASQIVFFSAAWSFTGRPVVDLFLMTAVINLLVYISIRTRQNWSSKFQFTMIGGLVGLQILGIACLRFDGVYGNGRPKLTWRWQPRPADFEFDQASSTVELTIDTTKEFVWAGFRGSDRLGALDQPTNIDWSSAAPGLVWSKKIGGGWSSFAIADGICITHEQRAEFETVVCYELATGRQIWKHADLARFKEFTGGEGPRATPSIFGTQVYSLGATGILNCLNVHTGELQWSRSILEENQIENRIFGMAGSPLVTDKYVLVTPGGKGSSVIAYDRFSGNLVWASGDQIASYSSLQLAVLCGIETILNFNGDGLSCHELATGKTLFDIPWISNASERNNVCQPLVFSDPDGSSKVFISSGYDQGSALFEIYQNGSVLGVNKLWANKLLKSKFSSVVKHNDHIYGLDNGILVCLDRRSGERKWKQGRYGHGQLIRIGGELIVQAEAGFLAQVNCNPIRFREVARVEGLKSRTWNHPASNGRYLLIRNDRQAICYDLRFKQDGIAEKWAD